MNENKNKTDLVTFMSNPNYDKGLRMRATIQGKTKSELYREIINKYLNR